MDAAFPVNWELNSLYPHPATAEFRTAVDDFKQTLEQLATDSDSLPPVTGTETCSQTWGAFLERYEAVSAEASALQAFIECHAAADAADRTFQKYEGELSALSPLRSRIATSVEFAFQSADEATFQAFIAGDERLRRNRYFLMLRRRNAALRLPKDQELLAADLDVDGLHAWSRLYDRLSGALRIRVMERGELIEKSPGQVLFDSPQRSVRENNFFAANKAWETLSETCADALNHLAGSRLTRYRRLNVDHLAVPLSLNHLQRQTLDTMWSTVSDRKGCLSDYLRKKAELLGLRQLSWYDQAAPLPCAGGAAESELSYEEACRQVVSSFSAFSPDLGEFARMALTTGWVEVENRPGKRQGGFCTDLPTRKQSRIFMTFTNSADSMSTLAHELGHAFHTWILRNEPVFLRDYPMNLAETASTFAEAVLGEHRLNSCRTRAEKLVLLDHMLSDAVAYLMNIHARFLFEDRFHRERAAGEVTAERLCELMVEAQKESYRNTLADDGWNPLFWVSKLHFYISGWPFYNFPYTFGYLLSLGAFSLAKDTPGFPEQFNRFLLATGSQDAEEAVQYTLGFDLRQRAFWDRSLDIIESRVQQFLKLADE